MTKIIQNQDEIADRILNIALKRVFERIYSSLDRNTQELVESVFVSGEDKEKMDVVSKYFSDVKLLFEEELQKVKEELVEEIKLIKG